MLILNVNVNINTRLRICIPNLEFSVKKKGKCGKKDVILFYKGKRLGGIPRSVYV